MYEEEARQNTNHPWDGSGGEEEVGRWKPPSETLQSLPWWPINTNFIKNIKYKKIVKSGTGWSE